MKPNLHFKKYLEEDSFKKQMGQVLNMNPNDVGEDYLDQFIIANPIIVTNDNKKYKLNGNIEFKVVFRGDNLITIQDISKPDIHNKKLSDFPHGLNSSPNFGKKYTMTKDAYNNLIQWRIPKPEPPNEGPMGPI